jgi:hypothetical protein
MAQCGGRPLGTIGIEVLRVRRRVLWGVAAEFSGNPEVAVDLRLED